MYEQERGYQILHTNWCLEQFMKIHKTSVPWIWKLQHVTKQKKHLVSQQHFADYACMNTIYITENKCVVMCS